MGNRISTEPIQHDEPPLKLFINFRNYVICRGGYASYDTYNNVKAYPSTSKSSTRRQSLGSAVRRRRHWTCQFFLSSRWGFL